MPSKTPRRKPRTETSHRRRVSTGLTAVAAGAGTLVVAAAPAAASTPALTGLLTQGTKGPNVGRVQRALHIDASGRFDRGTRRAVLKFQRKDHLLVDGIVGPQTWDALFHITPPPVAETSSSYSSNSTSSTSTATSAGSGGYSIPAGIVQCESGGNYSAVNSSSGAGGAYQIMPSTWQAYGGQGLPQDASKAAQDSMAAKIYATAGPSAWSC